MLITKKRTHALIILSLPADTPYGYTLPLDKREQGAPICFMAPLKTGSLGR